MINKNYFRITTHDTYYGLKFSNVLQKFEKYCNFYGYETQHIPHISKHFFFEINWKKITNNMHKEVDNIKSNDDVNSLFKNIEYLFDKYFGNNHLFIIPTENYSFIEYNTKTLRIEKHITKKEIIHVNCDIDDTCYTDMKISPMNYDIIKEFEENQKPIYNYCLPEDITFFNHIYCNNGNYNIEQSQILALSDNYIYYINVQK
jgi:hypothetical protein